jgi:hypothetical protein
MMDHTFKSGKKLETFLRMLAEESVNKVYEDALIGEKAEEEVQDAEPEQQSPPEDSEDTVEKETELDDETAVKKEDETEAIPAGEDITFYMLRDKLNVIRSGKSLKDAEVKADLQAYFDRLDDVEKEALYTFLDSIGKVMIDVISGTQALDPSDAEVDIEMSHGKGHEHASEDENMSNNDRVAQASQDNASDAPSPENDSAPIKVGQPQITEHVRKRIKELMR